MPRKNHRSGDRLEIGISSGLVIGHEFSEVWLKLSTIELRD